MSPQEQEAAKRILSVFESEEALAPAQLADLAAAYKSLCEASLLRTEGELRAFARQQAQQAAQQQQQGPSFNFAG